MRTLAALFLVIVVVATACGAAPSTDAALEPTAPSRGVDDDPTVAPEVQQTSAEAETTVPVSSAPVAEPEETEGFLLGDFADGSDEPGTVTETVAESVTTTTAASATTTPADTEVVCGPYHRLFGSEEFLGATTINGYVDAVRSSVEGLSIKTKTAMEGWLGLVQYGSWSSAEVKERTKRLDDYTVQDCGVPFIALSSAIDAGFVPVCSDQQDIDPDSSGAPTTTVADYEFECVYPYRTPPSVFPCFKLRSGADSPYSRLAAIYTNFNVIDCESGDPVVLLANGSWGPNPLD